MAVGTTLKKAAKKVKSATQKIVRGAGKALGVNGKKRKKTSSRKKTTSKK